MEKIYIENEKKINKKSVFKKFLNDKGSMTALVVIAFVGILSLMVFGFNQISFAADESVAQLPNKFVSGEGDSTTKTYGNSSTYPDAGAIMPILGFHAILDDEGTRIPMFCIEYNVSYGVNQNYSVGSEITDQGLIYLMSQLYPNKPVKDASGNELDEMVQVWITQTAIWSYLYEIGDSKNTNFATVNDKVKSVDQLFVGTNLQAVVSTPGSTIYNTFGINDIIAKAKEYRNSLFTTLTISKKSDTISVTNDNKYYQSDLISVVGATSSPIINSFESYSVDLSRTPEGTILVDEKGNVYDDVKKMAPTAKFYVRVPVNKVTDENKDLEISILGNFKMYGANAYTSGSYQKVANVKLRNQSKSEPLNIQLNYTPDVPDTGMGIAQTIYFVGLIILLSGVGIIYANAKPETSK